jgi:DinB superfamily
MDCKDLLLDGFSRVDENFRAALGGLSRDQLLVRPDADANPVAWLAWHLTRVMDDHVSELAGREQAWLEQGWHARFDRPADGNDTGYGHTAQQVASVQPRDAGLLLAYFEAVYSASTSYLRGLSCQDLDRVIDAHTFETPVTAGVRIISVLDDCAQHTGQMGYVRGLVVRRAA